MADTQRIDLWLWATRIFKSRTIASDACKKGRVYIADRKAKPATLVSIGDKVYVRKPPITFSFEVRGLPSSRVGAKLVEQYLVNITPAEEYEQLQLHQAAMKLGRAKGTGRPTKKERRDLEQFISPNYFDNWWEEGEWSEDDEIND